MRSRYSAYALGLNQYLLNTWHPNSRPKTLKLDPFIRWVGLTVLDATSSGESATVDFVAKFKKAGRLHSLAEHSRFVLEDGRWFYVDGDVP